MENFEGTADRSLQSDNTFGAEKLKGEETIRAPDHPTELNIADPTSVIRALLEKRYASSIVNEIMGENARKFLEQSIPVFRELR